MLTSSPLKKTTAVSAGMAINRQEHESDDEKVCLASMLPIANHSPSMETPAVLAEATALCSYAMIVRVPII